MNVLREKSLHGRALRQFLFGFDLNGTADFRDVFRVLGPEKFPCISARRCSRRSLPRTEQFRAMAFAKMTWRESLRDIEACLSARSSKLYHLGVRKAVARSTPANASGFRGWRIWADSRRSSFAKRGICMLPSRLSWSSRTRPTL